MAEVLSQSQIDALLNSVREGSLDHEPENTSTEKKYKKYDFYSPKKFTKDRLKLLSSIYENYARIISSQLNSLLRLNCEIELATVEEQRYHEFSNALTESDVLVLLNTKTSEPIINEPVIIHTSSQLILSMLDRILGGSGDADTEDRGFSSYTEIELSVYENMIQHIVPGMKDAWSDYLDVGFEYFRVESNPSLVQVVSPDEIIVIVVLDVTLKATKGKINICLPSNLLVNLFKIFEKTVAAANKNREYQEEKSPEEILSSLKESTLEVTAKFGETQVLLSDIFNMQIGDVVNLNRSKDEDVILYVENEPWFKGKMGVYKQNLAVKISGEIEKL